MPLKIKANKVRPKTIRPASSNRTNSVLANSSNSFLTPGSVAILGVLLFIAFVVAQIIFNIKFLDNHYREFQIILELMISSFVFWASSFRSASSFSQNSDTSSDERSFGTRNGSP